MYPGMHQRQEKEGQGGIHAPKIERLRLRDRNKRGCTARRIRRYTRSKVRDAEAKGTCSKRRKVKDKGQEQGVAHCHGSELSRGSENTLAPRVGRPRSKDKSRRRE